MMKSEKEEDLNLSVKVLAFDVSETLQTGSDKNEDGCGQAMVMGREVISNAYSVMLGGKKTANLIREAQRQGIRVVLVTNNNKTEVDDPIPRTLEFFKNYGINLTKEDYYSVEDTYGKESNKGNKAIRLEEIRKKENIGNFQLKFFDDSNNNIKDAKIAGFDNVVHVDNMKTTEEKAKILQEGIMRCLDPVTACSNESYLDKEQKEQMKKLFPDAFPKEKEKSLDEIIGEALDGVEKYQELKGSHLNFFQRLFDGQRGVQRAKKYGNAFKKANLPQFDKLCLLRTLLGSGDGETLKEKVAGALGYEGDVKAAKDFVEEQIKKELEGKAEENQPIKSPLAKRDKIKCINDYNRQFLLFANSKNKTEEAKEFLEANHEPCSYKLVK